MASPDRDTQSQIEILKASIKKIALENVLSDLAGETPLAEYLHRWWCRHYSRPYKDPLVETYTLEELLLEFFEITFFENEELRNKARSEFENEDEDEEEYLKELMGEGYQTADEMIENLEIADKKGKSNG